MMTTCVSSARAAGRASSHPLSRPSAVSLSVAALLGMPMLAFAQAETPALPQTVVTATRTPTRVDELVSDTVVIERAQIERQAGRTLPELLARVAGVQMTANGGAGKASSVFI